MPLHHFHLIDRLISIYLKAGQRRKDSNSSKHQLFTDIQAICMNISVRWSVILDIEVALPSSLHHSPWLKSWKQPRLGWWLQGNSVADPWLWGCWDRWAGLCLWPSLRTQSVRPESRLERGKCKLVYTYTRKLCFYLEEMSEINSFPS